MQSGISFDGPVLMPIQACREEFREDLCSSVPSDRKGTNVLSESGTHSDRIWAFPRLPVRIRLSFGQDLDFSSTSCPNPALFRTGYGLFLGFLSESGSLSDRLWAFPRLPVRILHSFGQDMDFSSASCPNPALFRTGEGLFFDFLSESSSHSDWIRFFPRLPVRIQLSFGQDLDFSSAPCPNPALIRTGEGFSSTSCPNPALIRTG